MPNYDPDTDCHYGCISCHSLDGDALATIYEGDSLTYLAYVAEVKAKLKQAVIDHLSDYFYKTEVDEAVDSLYSGIEDALNDKFEGNGEEEYLYEKDGYKLSNSPSLNCIFVEKSPYYTFAKHCSPCVPNAGDLDTPVEGGLKSYCLGPDWFEDEKPPYPVYRVSDGAILGAEV